MHYRQLTLWDMSVDIAAKLREEKRAKKPVFYHFNGDPLPMYSYSARNS